MIASVEGVVGAITADSVVIEVGGIGYRVFAAPAILSAATPGGKLKLHTYHLVREDQQTPLAGGVKPAEDFGHREGTQIGAEREIAIGRERDVAGPVALEQQRARVARA